MQRYGVRPSVCPVHPLQQRAAGLLLLALRAGHIDRQRRAPSNTAFSSKCEQCHAEIRGMRINADLSNKALVHCRLRPQRPAPLTRWTRLVSALAVVYNTTQPIQHSRGVMVRARRCNDVTRCKSIDMLPVANCAQL